MGEIDLKKLDDLIHSKARLAIMAALVSSGELDFAFFQENLKLTDGNLASHLRKLEDGGYVNVRKTFFNRRPRTIYKATKSGKAAFADYVTAIEKIIRA